MLKIHRQNFLHCNPCSPCKSLKQCYFKIPALFDCFKFGYIYISNKDHLTQIFGAWTLFFVTKSSEKSSQNHRVWLCVQQKAYPGEKFYDAVYFTTIFFTFY